MPLFFNNTKIMTPQFNGINLSVVKINGQNVFKKGNVNITYTLSSQMSQFNSYAPNFYIGLRNLRTGTEQRVGGVLGTTTISIPAVDGDEFFIYSGGAYNQSYDAVLPLKDDVSYAEGLCFKYPLDDADLSFSASLQIKGYYNPDSRQYEMYSNQSGTITSNYYVDLYIGD